MIGAYKPMLTHTVLYTYSHGQIRVDILIFYYILSINPSSLYCLNEVDKSMD